MKDSFALRLFDAAIITTVLCAFGLAPEIPRECRECKRLAERTEYQFADVERRIGEVNTALGVCQ